MLRPSHLRPFRSHLPIDCSADWVDPQSQFLDHYQNLVLGPLVVSSRMWGLLKEKTGPQGGSKSQWALFGQSFGGTWRDWKVSHGRGPSRGFGKEWGWDHHPEGERQWNSQEMGSPEGLVCLGDVRELWRAAEAGVFRAPKFVLTIANRYGGPVLSLALAKCELIFLLWRNKQHMGQYTGANFGSFI